MVNIEDIEVGDWVISDDPETEGEVIAKQVTRTFVRSDNNGIYDVEIDGEVISSTYNHEFWIDGKGWIEADDLEVGDALFTDDGDFVEVNSIGVREDSFEVYNFEVEDFNTYFVSTDGVLVHNINCDISQFPAITNKVNDSDSLLYHPKHINGVTIENGKILVKGTPLHARKVHYNEDRIDFVVKLDGNIHFGVRHQNLAKVAGDKHKVLAAGTLDVKYGRIKNIDNLSGHFLPSVEETKNFPTLLRHNGLDLKGAKLTAYTEDPNFPGSGKAVVAYETILD